MTNINWKVRIRNKTFWVTLVPAAILAIQTVAAIFGYTLDLNELSGRIVVAINAVFAALTVLGVVNDPTTKGITDSNRAMTYEKPL